VIAVTRWKNPADPDNVWGDQPSEEVKVPRQRQRPRPEQEPRRSASNIRPEGVSENVWGLAEQWVETGTATFGKRPPVNLSEFAKRYSETVNDSTPVLDLLATKGEPWATEVLARMVEMFWDGLEQGDRNSALLQFKFLDDEWEHWLDAAMTSVQVRWLKEHGHLMAPPAYPHKDENIYLQHKATRRVLDGVDRALAQAEDGHVPVKPENPLHLPIRNRSRYGSESEKGITTDDSQSPALPEASRPDPGHAV